MNKIMHFVALVAIAATATALNLKSVEEGACLNPPPPVADFDKKAFGNPSNVWWHLAWSKYYLYRVAQDVTGKDLGRITEKELKNSCLTFNSESPGIIAESGFNGKKRSYDLGPGNHPGSCQSKAFGQRNWDAETWVTMAGKDYFVAYTCFVTNQKGFTVAALKKNLDPLDVLKIRDHVLSLGFKAQYLFLPNVQNCEQ